MHQQLLPANPNPKQLLVLLLLAGAAGGCGAVAVCCVTRQCQTWWCLRNVAVHTHVTQLVMLGGDELIHGYMQTPRGRHIKQCAALIFQSNPTPHVLSSNTDTCVRQQQQNTIMVG